MLDKSNNTKYMKEYLKYALIFEKYVYIWEKAMNQANNQMREIYDRKSNLNTQLTYNTTRIRETSNDTKLTKEEKTKLYLRNSKTQLFIFFIMLFLIIVTSIISTNYYTDDKTKLIVVGMFLTFGMSIFFIVGFTCLVLSILNKNKYKKLQNEIRIPCRNEETPSQKNIRIKNELMYISNKENALNKNQETIFKELNIAKNNRMKLYSENILPIKYRSLSAVATLYEYLETGRCNTIQGHGGIYDTYENDLNQGLIIENLRNINNRLGSIESNQQLLYREIQQANSTLSYINSSLTKIKWTSDKISENTAISAVANQQTASSAQYLAWKAGQTVF